MQGISEAKGVDVINPPVHHSIRQRMMDFTAIVLPSQCSVLNKIQGRNLDFRGSAVEGQRRWIDMMLMVWLSPVD
jgi:hypothetical protein